MDENAKRLYQYLQNLITENISNNLLFRELSEDEKLRMRINLSKDLKKRGIEVPPDNIDIL